MEIAEAEKFVRQLRQGELRAVVRLHKYKPRDRTKAKIVFIGGREEETMSVAFAFPDRVRYHWERYLEANR
jgi:tagatose-1,6-bisphosphate aldolase non-catalytic subunit AgaZ/GatZ